MYSVICPSGKSAKVVNILADGRECDDMSKIVVPYKGFEIIYDHILPETQISKNNKKESLDLEKRINKLNKIVSA